MSIWFQTPSIAAINERIGRGLDGVIGIEFIEAGDDYLRARMPVDQRTRQPMGILHGGASVVLAESLASVGSMWVVDRSRFFCVGLEINANHLAAARDGHVTGIARPVHLGKSTHVWDIRLTNQQGKPSCIARCTMAVLESGRGA